MPSFLFQIVRMFNVAQGLKNEKIIPFNKEQKIWTELILEKSIDKDIINKIAF